MPDCRPWAETMPPEIVIFPPFPHVPPPIPEPLK